MALDYNPTTLGNIANETQFLNELNLNFSELATLLEDALSRSGSAPNTWEADQDANSYDLNNLSVLTAARINTGSLFVDGAELPSLQDIQDLYDLIKDELVIGVLAVPDIAALRALTGVQDGQRVSVTGYHPGSDIGGGEFYYDASRAKADHNGISVISPTVPWDGTKAGLDNFQGGVSESDPSGTGCFVMDKNIKIRPVHAGAVPGEESGAALQRYLDLVGAENPYRFDVTGFYKTQQALSLTNSALAEKQVDGYLSLETFGNIRDGSEISLLSIIGCQAWDFTGGFHLDGYSGFSSPKNTVHGLTLSDCRQIKIGRVDGRGGEGFLVNYNSSTNNNMAKIGRISADNFGWRAGMEKSRPYSYVGSSGGTTSSNHRSTINIDLDEFLDAVLLNGFLFVGDKFHAVMSYDRENHQAVVYPGWASSYDHGASPTADVILGGGVSTRGSDAGEGYFGGIFATNCGMALSDVGLYGCVVDRIVAQYCGTPYRVGFAPSSVGGFGSQISQLYTEACTIDAPLLASRIATSTLISPIAMNATEVQRLLPPASDSNDSSTLTIIGYATSDLDDQWLNEQETTRVISSAAILSSPRPQLVDGRGSSRTDRVITLSTGSPATNSRAWYSSRNAAFFGMPVYFEVSADNGNTVNGQVSIAHPNGVPDGTQLKAVLVGTDWQVSMLYPGPRSLAGSATYDPPSLTDGESATTTVTVTGAALGDFATASFGADLQGVTLDAWVSAADTVSVKFTNNTGGTVDLASATLRARVEKA